MSNDPLAKICVERVQGPSDWASISGDSVAETLNIATSGIPRSVLHLGDAVAMTWLRMTRNPWLDEIERMRRLVGKPGLAMMNLCYEWGCTTAVAQTADAEIIMARTVDWPFIGLGRSIVVSLEESPNGPVYFVSWPGFIGAVTAFAPGRFAIALNKAPTPCFTKNARIDQGVAAMQAFFRGGLPVTQLVRNVALQSRSFDEVVAAFEKPGKITSPGLITVAGTKTDEAALIERYVHASNTVRMDGGPIGAANDWLSDTKMRWPRAKGRTPSERIEDCVLRVQALKRRFPLSHNDDNWIVPPVLNMNTRAAITCNVHRGILGVQGYDVVLPTELPRIVTEKLVIHHASE